MLSTLIGKSLRETWGLLLGCAGLLFAFEWLYVWTISQLKYDDLIEIFKLLPPFIERLLPVPMSEFATATGRVAMGYSDPPVLIIGAVWGIARGSDAISGEINRGTMEMLLAQPVRRGDIVLASAIVATFGAAVIATGAWCGTAMGIAVTTHEAPLSPVEFILPALNLFALMFFIGGLATLVSSPDRYRWRTVGIMGGFVIVELMIEIVAQLVESIAWLKWVTFLSVYKPPRLVTQPERTAELVALYGGVLLGLGLLSYIAAGMIFRRRDLPAPL